MSMLKPFLLFFSGSVSYQTSDNLNSHTTNKTEYNQRAKFSREMDFVPLVKSTQPCKLTEPFISSHLLQSLEGQSIDRCNIVQ